MQESFLDVGTVSWTLLICTYFLSLHIGVQASVLEDDSQTEAKICIDFSSILDMLEVLK